MDSTIPSQDHPSLVAGGTTTAAHLPPGWAPPRLAHLAVRVGRVDGVGQPLGGQGGTVQEEIHPLRGGRETPGRRRGRQGAWPWELMEALTLGS